MGTWTSDGDTVDEGTLVWCDGGADALVGGVEAAVFWFAREVGRAPTVEELRAGFEAALREADMVEPVGRALR